jgi:hypothetical protein
MAELLFDLTGEFRDDALGQNLAKLNAPLIERIDIPDRALREDAVFVECNQLAERGRCQLLQQNRVGRPVSFEHAMRNEPIGRPLNLDFVSRLAKCERFALRKDVGEQHVMLLAKLVECLVERDEVAGNEASALVDELVE